MPPIILPVEGMVPSPQKSMTGGIPAVALEKAQNRHTYWASLSPFLEDDRCASTA